MAQLPRISHQYRLPTFFLLESLNILIVECAPLCGEGQFFDIDAEMCDYCYTICDSANITGTLSKCLRNCPGYLTTTKLTTMTTAKPETSSVSSSYLQLVVIITMVIACVIIVAIGTTIYYRHHLRTTIGVIISTWKPTQTKEENLPYPVEESDTPEQPEAETETRTLTAEAEEEGEADPRDPFMSIDLQANADT